MIKRQNILDLLGGDSKKYHSCIITSYSFDVMFFEHAVLPKLSRAGITNINILVDASMFEKQLSSFSGKEYLDRKHGYSVTPIRMNAAFHPKLLLAVGKSKGFLAVGSGNLTGSGLSFNEEIWGTFFYKEGHDNSIPIFGQVKSYLHQFKSLVKGVNLIKLEWVEMFSPWYQKLDSEANGFSFIDNSNVSLLTSFGDRSFFKEVILPLTEKPESIQILSPFYNKNGQFLDDLINNLHPKKIHCIVNSEMGSLPLDYKNDFVQYTDWSSFAEKDKRHPNLHAKAIQISYIDKTYFILGSANATVEAFGNNIKNTLNAEAVLVIETLKPRDYFDELGIVFSETGNLDIDDVTINKQEETADESILNFENYIQVVEIKNNAITIYFSKFKIGTYQLIVEDGDGQNLIIKEVLVNDSTLEISITPLNEEPFRCYLKKNDEKASSYGYFHDVSLLLKTNPDERLSRFNDLKHHSFFDDLEMELFLDFLSDENIFHSDGVGLMKAAPIKKPLIDDATEEKETVSSELFNHHSSEIGQSAFNEIHITTIIEEFLNALNFKAEETTDELSDNIEESELIENEDGGSNVGAVSHRSLELSYTEGNRIKRKLNTILVNIEQFVQKAEMAKDSNKDVKSINAILIGFNLMLKYWNKKINRKSISVSFKYTNLNELKKLENLFNLERQPSQLNSSADEVAYFVDIYLIDDLKTHLEKNESITLTKLDEADLLVESTGYFNQYISGIITTDGVSAFLIHGYCCVLNYIKLIELKTQDTNSTWEEHKIKLLKLVMIVISSCGWSAKSQTIKKLIALNTFCYLDVQIDTDELKSQLLSKVNALENNSLIENLEELIRLYDSYQKFMVQINTNPSRVKQELNSYNVGSIVYSQVYGFAELAFVYTNKEINIITPLGNYDDKTKVYGYSKKFIGYNAKFFN